MCCKLSNMYMAGISPQCHNHDLTIVMSLAFISLSLFVTLFLCYSDLSLTLEWSMPDMSDEPRDILGAVCETGGWTL